VDATIMEHQLYQDKGNNCAIRRCIRPKGNRWRRRYWCRCPR
jgi:hypothetical protein